MPEPEGIDDDSNDGSADGDDVRSSDSTDEGSYDGMTLDGVLGFRDMLYTGVLVGTNDGILDGMSFG